MPEPSGTPAPEGTVPSDEYYSQDERRATSRDLSYGTGWKRAGWTEDDNHVVELFWIRDTKELVAFYVAYDWSQVDPAEAAVSPTEAAGAESGGGVELGRVLRVQEDATSEIYVEVIAQLGSKHECREVVRGWHWLQHHPDGLDHIRERAARHT